MKTRNKAFLAGLATLLSGAAVVLACNGKYPRTESVLNYCDATPCQRSEWYPARTFCDFTYPDPHQDCGEMYGYSCLHTIWINGTCSGGTCYGGNVIYSGEDTGWTLSTTTCN